MFGASKDLEEILKKLPSESPTVSFQELALVFARSHAYLEQWKNINVDTAFILRIIDIVQRYEANGLQLKGRGVLVLSMIFQYNKSPINLTEEYQRILVEVLVRIGIEHAMIHLACVDVLQFMVDNKNMGAVTGSTIFEIGLAIAETLPTTIKSDNFRVFLSFALRAIETDKSCFAPAITFLSTIIKYVEQDFHANYFLLKRVPVLISEFHYHLDNAKDDAYDAESEQIISKSMHLMSHLIVLHPHHPSQLMESSLPALAAGIIRRSGTYLTEQKQKLQASSSSSSSNGNSSSIPSAIITGAFCVLAALCRDPQTCGQLRSMLISEQDLYAHLSWCFPAEDPVVESALDLFLPLYVNECLMITNNTCVSQAETDAREFCIKFVTSIIGKASAALEARNFAYVYRILYKLDRYVPLSSCFSVFLALEGMMRKAVGEFENMEEFDLENDSIVDIVVMLSGQREEVWKEVLPEPRDTDFCAVIAETREQIRSCRSSVVVDDGGTGTGTGTGGASGGGRGTSGIEVVQNSSTSSTSSSSSSIRSNGTSSVSNSNSSSSSSRNIPSVCLFDSKDLQTMDYIVGPSRLSGALGTTAWNHLEQQHNSSEAAVSGSNKKNAVNCSGNKNFENPIKSSSSSISSSRTTITTTHNNNLSLAAAECSDTPPPPPPPASLIASPSSPCTKRPALAQPESIVSKLLHHVMILKDFSTLWEVESIEVTCRKILLMCAIAGVHGDLAAIEPIIDLSELEETLWLLLTDDRLGLSSFPSMQRKCIQLLSSIISTPGREAVGNCADLVAYLTKVITSREDSTGSPSDMLLLYYSSLSCLLAMCRADKIARRKVIAHFAGIHSVLLQLDPVLSQRPLMHFAVAMTEFLNRMELDGEECLVSLIVRSLGSVSRTILSQACFVIYAAGKSNPGLVYRGIGRREVENVLWRIIRDEVSHAETLVQNKMLLLNDVGDISLSADLLRKEKEQRAALTDDNEEEGSEGRNGFQSNIVFSGSDLLLLNAFKACIVLVHDVNMKPTWVSSPWSFHWSCYQSGLRNRPLITTELVDMLVASIDTAPPKLRLLYFSTALSVASNLMYNCSDGIISPSKNFDSAILHALKEALIAKILPWLPIALDFIIIGKKKIQYHKRRQESLNRHNNKPPLTVKKGAPVVDGAGGGVNSASTMRGSSNVVSLNRRGSAVDALKNRFGKKKEAAAAAAVDKTTSNSNSAAAAGTAVASVADTPPANDKVAPFKVTPALEILTENTLEILYSFFCMDDMFPMSTYLRYEHLFKRTPLIACVSYFMGDFKTNEKVQRKGLDFIKYFADNAIGISTIAMHSPNALINAVKVLNEVQEVQFTFCKLISIIAKADEFARENIIRFDVHLPLIDILLCHHPEKTRLACLAVQDLGYNDSNVLAICDKGDLVSALLSNLDAQPTEIKVQIEVYRTLVSLENVVPDVVHTYSSDKRSTYTTLVKSKRFLQGILKEEKYLPSGYETRDVEALLVSSLAVKNDKCTIS